MMNTTVLLQAGIEAAYNEDENFFTDDVWEELYRLGLQRPQAAAPNEYSTNKGGFGWQVNAGLGDTLVDMAEGWDIEIPPAYADSPI